MTQSLYVHIPFCKSKCSYCSFASVAGKDALIPPYLTALEKEAHFYKGSHFETLYIGGGTPTSLSAQEIRFLFKILKSNFTFAADAEVTCEANPSTFDLEKAQVLRAEGVTRVSLGVQSLDDENLRWLCRPHNRRQVLDACALLKKAGFRNINLDLICSLPGQSREGIREDVDGLISLDTPHISLYALSIAPTCALFKKGARETDPDRQAEDYQAIVGQLRAAGYCHYEVSNFAKPGYECRHNIHIWRGGDYVGLGAAAHSHQAGRRFWNADALEEYIRRMETQGCATAGEERLDALGRFMETFLIGLRLTDGVDREELEGRFGVTLSPEKIDLLESFVRRGWLSREASRVRATEAGRPVLDEICGRLI